jgi:hypothetical protein
MTQEKNGIRRLCSRQQTVERQSASRLSKTRRAYALALAFGNLRFTTNEGARILVAWSNPANQFDSSVFPVNLLRQTRISKGNSQDMLVQVQLAERSYDIAITHDGMAGIGVFARARSKGTAALIIADANVGMHAESVAASLNEAGFSTQGVQLPPGENQKCLASAMLLYDRLAEMNADRKTLIVAVGGGVIGDLAGFVAATYITLAARTSSAPSTSRLAFGLPFRASKRCPIVSTAAAWLKWSSMA